MESLVKREVIKPDSTMSSGGEGKNKTKLKDDKREKPIAMNDYYGQLNGYTLIIKKGKVLDLDKIPDIFMQALKTEKVIN